ncbi:MAG: SOUL family heme-binding protein [Chthoniobacteraceae bacterium]
MSLPILFALTVAAASFWLVSNSRAATETPDYKVIRSDDRFQIRDYSTLEVASTEMKGNEMNDGFGDLFRYISGQNEESQKIAMTTPVLIDTANEAKTMSFIMPKQTVESGTPKPAGETVKLGKVEASRFAVYRFEGGRTKANEIAAQKKLMDWLEAQKIASKGAPIFAYYDPPWTPAFLRRNEVMIRVDARRD